MYLEYIFPRNGILRNNTKIGLSRQFGMDSTIRLYLIQCSLRQMKPHGISPNTDR